MKKITKRIPTIRITENDKNLRKSINAFIEHKKINVTSLVRIALKEYLNKDITDRELTSINLQKLTKRIEKLEDLIQLLLEQNNFFIRTWFAHTPELPDEYKITAWKNSNERYEKYMQSFNKHLLQETTIIQQLLMSNIETENEGS